MSFTRGSLLPHERNRALLAAAVLLGTATSLYAGDWPRWRGPDRNGISKETGWSTTWPKEGPKRLWQASIGVGYGSESVSRGHVYVMGNESDTDTVFCFDANDGKTVWKHSYPCLAKDPNGYPGPRCTPTAVEGSVITLSRAGNLFCLDAASGKVQWSKDYKTDFAGKVPTWGFAASPLVAGNRVFIEPGGEGASAVALDKETGKVLWQAGNDPAAYSSPVEFDLKGQPCVVFFNAVGLVGRSAKDGTELWRYPWKTSWDVNAATPVVDGTRVFISSGYNTGCAVFDVGTTPPVTVWKNKNMRNHCNSCVLWKGNYYGFDEKELRCLDAKTGDVKWSESKYGKGSLFIADGKLIIYGDRGSLGVAEPTAEGYREIAFARVAKVKETPPPNTNVDTWAVPVLANGKLYCRNLDELFCLDLKGQ